LIVGWCGLFLFFVVPRQFSQVVGEWPENQILIPDLTYFHCPGATLLSGAKDNTSGTFDDFPDFEGRIFLKFWSHKCGQAYQSAHINRPP